MGWTEFYAGRGCNKKDLMTHELEQYGGLKVLKCSVIGSTYYAAIQIVKTGNVCGAVCLLRYSNKTGMFAYKDMDETEGPCYYDCPKSIINLLSPTTSEWANEWRKKCLNKQPSIASQLNKLPIGTIIEVDGEKLIKQPACYQFKKPFWEYVNKWCYMPKNRIYEFKVIS